MARLLRKLVLNRLIDLLFLCSDATFKPQQWIIPSTLLFNCLLDFGLNIKLVLLLGAALYTLCTEKYTIIENRLVSLSLLLISLVIKGTIVNNFLLWSILLALGVYENIYFIQKQSKHKEITRIVRMKQILETTCPEKFLLDDDDDDDVDADDEDDDDIHTYINKYKIK